MEKNGLISFVALAEKIKIIDSVELMKHRTTEEMSMGQ